jgi:hypothetical protein
LASTEGFMDIKLRRRKIKSSKWEKKNILKSQQSQPIPVIVNRYAPLDSIQKELEASQNHNRTSEIALVRKKNEMSSQCKEKENSYPRRQPCQRLCGRNIKGPRKGL